VFAKLASCSMLDGLRMIMTRTSAFQDRGAAGFAGKVGVHVPRGALNEFRRTLWDTVGFHCSARQSSSIFVVVLTGFLHPAPPNLPGMSCRHSFRVPMPQVVAPHDRQLRILESRRRKPETFVAL
jgi:hypothetical protein